MLIANLVKKIDAAFNNYFSFYISLILFALFDLFYSTAFWSLIISQYLKYKK